MIKYTKEEVEKEEGADEEEEEEGRECVGE